MKLLVTRPTPDNETTSDRLRALGHDVVSQPLLFTTFLPLDEPVDPVAVAVTSRNGVRAMLRWEESAAWRDLPLFAVGPSTADVAEEAGFTDIRAGDADGAALARFIAKSIEPGSKPIVYPCAADRAEELEKGLRVAGFDVAIAVAYRMSEAEAFSQEVIAALETGSVEGLLVYSRRSAAAFLDLADRSGLTQHLSGVTVFALSPAVASVFGGSPIGHIEVALRPREDELFALIPPAQGGAHGGR